MAEYDIDFALRAAEVAQATAARGADVPTQRVAVYLARVAIELSLKALLERAGVPVGKIRGHSHRLAALLAEADGCEVLVEVAQGNTRWLPGSRLRAVTVQVHGIAVNVGMIVEAEAHGASTYPNELRYGVVPSDFPAEAVAAAAVAIGAWARDHWGGIRVSEQGKGNAQ